MNSDHQSKQRGLIGAALLCLAAAWTLAQAAPLSAAAAAAEDPAWAYRIQPGDNLFDLSASYLDGKAGWRDLQRLNKVADPHKLPPGGTLKLPIRWLKREASVAQAVFAQGDVSLQRPPAPPLPIKAGTELRSGDVLRTGVQASLSLRFVDGSRLLLAPQSEVTIEHLLVYGRSAIPAMQLRLHKGSADSKIQPALQRPADYQLRTPSLNLGVRGTEFRVQLTEDGSGTRAQVLEGVVAAGPARVEAGFGVIANGPQAQPPAQPQIARLLPPPDLSGLAPKLERIPLSLRWQAQAGARAYRAQVYTAGNFEQLLLDGRFEQPLAQWPDLPDGRYSLRVRAIDALGLEGLAADTLFVLKARPEPPFARAPAVDANVYGNSVGLAWAKPLNALAYRLQVATEPDFASPVLDRSDLTATELDLPLPHGRYFWRLASIARDNDLGPFGDPQSFTLKPVPPAPAPQPPEIGDDTLRLRWSAAPGMASYELQWAQDAEFKQLLQESKTEQPELTLPRPPAGSYYLRVRSVDAQGYAGPYGAPQQVDIPRSRWLWLLLPAGLLLLTL